ncbi:DUF222 domain-containing protein [Microlunatus parietis]|uniref:DUF222 domain-containing protein n=1 Tax=Microlunatus parietis TaxID=682979 RepID=A0A7Y9ICP8_9ACTN|nr:DUF222 domain-containing protein [Microlunatus parietis]NYE74493.1 hypothetical protein [Microlunatus parietis]
MFDSSTTEDGAAAGILRGAEAAYRARISAENELLGWAVAWADTWPAESITEDQLRVSGGARGVRPGGDGTPEVNDLAVATFGAKIDKGYVATLGFLGDALDLRDRLPGLWAKITNCEVIGWQGCKVARMTCQLTFEQARAVDVEVADHAGLVPWPKLERLTQAAIIRVDGERIEREAAEAKKKRGVWLSQTDEHGLKGIYGRLTPPEAIRLYARIQEIAACLPLGTATADERRADAMAMLGNELQATEVVARHRQPDLFDLDLEAAVQPAPGGDGAVEETELHPSLRDRPVVPSPESAIFRAAVEQLFRKLKPADLLPKATLSVYVDADALERGTGVCRVPGVGPTALGVVKDWLGHCSVTVRPVIDLNDPPPPVDRYEIPPRHRRHLALRQPASSFPWSTAMSGLDLDHVIPYLSRKRGGPPGQTGVDGLTPTSRTEHRLVTHGGWQRRQPEPGTMIYRSPYGDVYVTNHAGTHALGSGSFAQLTWAACTGRAAA